MTILLIMCVQVRVAGSQLAEILGRLAIIAVNWIVVSTGSSNEPSGGGGAGAQSQPSYFALSPPINNSEQRVLPARRKLVIAFSSSETNSFPLISFEMFSHSLWFCFSAGGGDGCTN